jgi:hypothetical protein
MIIKSLSITLVDKILGVCGPRKNMRVKNNVYTTPYQIVVDHRYDHSLNRLNIEVDRHV